MKEAIREMLIKANEEEDLELATIASDILYALTYKYDCPADWSLIRDELYKEFENCEWIMNSVYEFKFLTETGGV